MVFAVSKHNKGEAMIGLILVVAVLGVALGWICVGICSILVECNVRYRLITCALASTIISTLVSTLSYETCEKQARTLTGLPIQVATREDLVGKVITPIGLVSDSEMIIVVDDDHKSYSLLNVGLEAGLNITNMVSRKLIVYKKGRKTCIGIEEQAVQAVPTQIGYTNK
jgi:hypothetical protein